MNKKYFKIIIDNIISKSQYLISYNFFKNLIYSIKKSYLDKFNNILYKVNFLIKIYINKYKI